MLVITVSTAVYSSCFWFGMFSGGMVKTASFSADWSFEGVHFIISLLLADIAASTESPYTTHTRAPIDIYPK